MEERVVSVAELAELCGIGVRQVQNLANEGVFVKAGRGEYVLGVSLRNFVESRVREDNAEGIDVELEAAREERAKREIAETRAGLMKGRVVETEAVMFVVGEVLTLVRNRFLSLPDRLIPEIVRPDEVVAAKVVAERMVRDILTELVVSGDAISEQTDFKRVSAPVGPADVGLSFSAGEDCPE